MDLSLGGVRARAFLPRAVAHAPAVIFSHGFGGSRLGYKFLGEAWARAGFAAVHVGHDASEMRLLANAPDRMQALLDAIDDPRRWAGRARDVSTAIDALGALEGRVDPARIAVAGHSFGAYTALLTAGARVRFRGERLQLRDPRPRAFIALSGPGYGDRGLEPGSYGEIERPVLAMFGTRDVGPRGKGVEWRSELFDGLPAGAKLELVIDGAVHETFAGAPAEDGTPPDPAHLELIARATTAFLRAHLRGETAALDDLRALAAARREK